MSDEIYSNVCCDTILLCCVLYRNKSFLYIISIRFHSDPSFDVKFLGEKERIHLRGFS